MIFDDQNMPRPWLQLREFAEKLPQDLWRAAHR